ncbi:hypothetical protein CSUB01_11083 [Colletotrichum sublineola]|uniref:Uncharacterized protein n=1 Tax=Colletotrichum sublineola TaxID=1173701 RepID=A0A066X7Q4_COLSU|nr:hypothetical protein CSUB01_11083 [Colletotrichum sublineola]
MHPLSFLLILFASSAAALPATPATPTAPPDSPGSPFLRPPAEPFLPTVVPVATDAAETSPAPAPTPIYSTLSRQGRPSTNSSSPSVANSTAPCAASRRPLRLGPARLHRRPPQDSAVTPTSVPTSASPAAPAVAIAAVAAAAVETAPADSGPRDYASLLPAAPGVTPRPEPNLAEMGYDQTTYYSCVTQEASVHCGWHRPIMVAPANNAAAAAAAGPSFPGRRTGTWMLVAGVAAVLLAG